VTKEESNRVVKMSNTMAMAIMSNEIISFYNVVLEKSKFLTWFCDSVGYWTLISRKERPKIWWGEKVVSLAKTSSTLLYPIIDVKWLKCHLCLYLNSFRKCFLKFISRIYFPNNIFQKTYLDNIFLRSAKYSLKNIHKFEIKHQEYF